MEELQVVKIGSSSIIKNNEVDYGAVKRIGYELTQLKEEENIYSILVVSGAIPLGMKILGYNRKPTDKITLQRCACVGQKELMAVYDIGFKGHAITSQLLLTYHNLSNKEEEKNVEQRLKDDISQGIVTLINYNDGVDMQEIKLDNDRLAALIAKYINAKRLLMLSSVDGLEDEKGEITKEIRKITPRIKRLCRGANHIGTGGMTTKFEAAEITMKNGIEMILGNIKYKIRDLIYGNCPRTVFLPQKYLKR